jgi:DNA polymerase IV
MAQDHVLLKKVKELFTKLYTRRLLVRLIGVRFTDLIPGVYQPDLYEDSQECIRLYQSIDSVKKQYGENYLMRASGADVTPYNPIMDKLLKAFKL